MTRELKKLCAKLGLMAEFCESVAPPLPHDWPEGTKHYTVTLRIGDRMLATEYHAGPGIKGAPTIEDVVACLVSDADCAAESFDEFCSNLGYSTDSRKAYVIWEACNLINKKLGLLLGLHRAAIENAARDW